LQCSRRILRGCTRDGGIVRRRSSSDCQNKPTCVFIRTLMTHRDAGVEAAHGRTRTQLEIRSDGELLWRLTLRGSAVLAAVRMNERNYPHDERDDRPRRPATRYLRSSDYVRTRFHADPSAAFGAYSDGDIVGSNFAGNWGSVGFFGPLTIRPDLWDRHIGTRLIEPILSCFDRWGTGTLAFLHFLTARNTSPFTDVLDSGLAF
jgi:hypothetical protein